MQVLVVGGSGFLGSYVMSQCQKMRLSVVGTSAHEDLLNVDISDPEQALKAIEYARPDCIINCAAMTDVDECERQPEAARLVNSVGPKNLAEICSSKKIRLIHVSTDAVFNGERGGYSEESDPDPINLYAKTKLEGERFVSSKASDYVIVRTNFYGLNSNGKGLLNWMLRNLVERKEFMGFDDVIFNPLWVSDLAECLVRLADIPYSGILNCAGNQTLSKYEFARTVANSLGYKDANIKKASSDQMPSLVARRPKKTYLLNNKMRELLKNTKIHTIEEVLRDPSFDIYRPEKP